MHSRYSDIGIYQRSQREIIEELEKQVVLRL